MVIAHQVTAYDAAYVALAERLSLPLIAADEALVRHLAEAGLDLRWRGE